jgi:hypothetical protein
MIVLCQFFHNRIWLTLDSNGVRRANLPIPPLTNSLSMTQTMCNAKFKAE